MNEIDKLIALQKQFAKLYKGNLIGVSSSYVQITPELFFKLFSTYKIETTRSNDHLSAEYGGIEIVTVVEKTEEDN